MWHTKSKQANLIVFENHGATAERVFFGQPENVRRSLDREIARGTITSYTHLHYSVQPVSS
jgi:hypothetical protein